MGQKGHIMAQKGLKMHEKRQKLEFLDLKNLLFFGIFLSEIRGYPPPPLTDNRCAQKSLAERGGGGDFSGKKAYLSKQCCLLQV